MNRSFVSTNVDVFSVETYWRGWLAFCQTIVRSPAVLFFLSYWSWPQSHERLSWHCWWVFSDGIASCLFGRNKRRLMWYSFERNTPGRFFLGEHAFGLVIKTIRWFIFRKGSNAAGSEFPAGFRKFGSPNLSGFGFSFLFTIIRVSDVLRIFHELPFDFTCLIGGYIFGFSPHSTILVQSSFFFRILLLLNVFIRRFGQCLIPTARLKIDLMHATFGVHFLIVIDFNLEWVNILVALVNTVRNSKVSFFARSRSIGTCQKVSWFCNRLSILSSGIWIEWIYYV